MSHRAIYGNERGGRRDRHSRLPREEIFLTTKSGDRFAPRLLPSVDESPEKLRTDYVDLCSALPKTRCPLAEQSVLNEVVKAACAPFGASTTKAADGRAVGAFRKRRSSPTRWKTPLSRPDEVNAAARSYGMRSPPITPGRGRVPKEPL